MILVDTSVWVDHLRTGESALADLLDRGMVLMHPLVIGELALGNVRWPEVVLEALHDMPEAVVAHDGEVLHFIREQGLNGTGIDYVDAHLLAAVRLTAGTSLWTRDKRLLGVADRLGLAAGLRH